MLVAAGGLEGEAVAVDGEDDAVGLADGVGLAVAVEVLVAPAIVQGSPASWLAVGVGVALGVGVGDTDAVLGVGVLAAASSSALHPERATTVLIASAPRVKNRERGEGEVP